MRDFDPTPAAVTYYRINAVGFAISLLAMFAATWCWLVDMSPGVASEPIVVGTFLGMGLGTAVFYLLPAMAPRRNWGYFIAWMQMAFSLTSITATLPTLLVLINFSEGKVKEWFAGKPVGFHGPERAQPAVLVALVGYYLVISAIPFGIAYAVSPDQTRDQVVQTVAVGDSHVTYDGWDVIERPLAAPDAVEAELLASEAPWTLAEQDGPVAVTVWATYCGSCSRQLNQIAERDSQVGYNTKHVTLALDCYRDGHDNRDNVRHKLGHTNISSTALCATDDRLDVDVLPTTIFFDASGNRRATLSGSQSAELLHQTAIAVER